MPIRRGDSRAAAGLLSPFGLAWRLQRGVLFSWMAGIAVFGAVFGGIGDQVDELFDSKATVELMRELGGGGSLVEAYFAAMMGLLGVVVAGYTVQALLRLRGEEAGGPAEALLATAVSRPRWLASHLLCAVIGAVLVLAALGVGTGLAYWAVSGDLNASADLLKITLAQLPPTLVLAGFTVVVFGLVPRFAVALSWTGFAVCLVVGQFGTLLRLPAAVIDISPFTHVPDLPADPLAATPLLIMLVVAAGLLAGGAVAFRRRSLALT
jgi:ABC-2 type transport system permease protein